MKANSKRIKPSMRASLFLPFLLGLSGHILPATAQSPGTFTPTGNLTTPRASHSATLLTNGKVLVAGGSSGRSGGRTVWASAELYDPATGTFAATGNMTTARAYHTATLLPNGNVLVAGGASIVEDDNARSPLTRAELYDPSTGTFITTGYMTTARGGHTATLLNNGKVLIAGGTEGISALASAELYDPAIGTFTPTSSRMTTSRFQYTAVLLSNGKVLIPGGYYADNTELYDPDNDTFSFTGGTTKPHLRAITASLLTNGKVLVTLEDNCDPGPLAEVYNPSEETFTATGNMTGSRVPTATVLPDGTVLVAGSNFAELGGSADLYDPVSGTFSTTSDMVMRRRVLHTATLLPDGTVLMSGGWFSGGDSVATAEIYHPAVLVPSPVLFSLSGDGRGPGAILHAGTSRLVSSSDPAVTGEALEIYGAGLVDGSVIPPQVVIGGRMAEVLFFGKAPGFAGLNQVNVRVPSGVAPGSAVPVRLNYLKRSSNEVTISVQ